MAELEAELVGGSEEAPVVEEKPVEETPSQPEDTQPEEVVEEPQGEPATEEPMLYETPDGRKVTAEVLQKEWKENFLPDYTRKSQELAKYKDINNPQEDVPEWQRDGYTPQSYADLIKIAKAEAIKEMQESSRAEQERVDSIKSAVQAEIDEIKKSDPKLDENVLFQHANKYGFSNLKSAYQNMKDMKNVAENVEQRTVKNLKKREADPISTTPNATIDGDDNSFAKFNSAAEYLAHLKANT